MIEHTTGGEMSLAELADQHHTAPSTILRLTAENSPKGAYPPNVANYINGCSKAASVMTSTCPQGCISTCLLDPVLPTAARKEGWLLAVTRVLRGSDRWL